MTLKCGCGCEGDAVFVVTGIDFDPRSEGGRGEPFKAPCCRLYASYLVDASDELGFPVTTKRLSDVAD